MNDEIKEMIEQMESIAITGKSKNGIKVDGYGLQQNELKMFLDYITNLQQENEDNLKCINSLKEQLDSVIKNNQELLEKWHKNNDKIVNLISENERLKEEYKNKLDKTLEVLQYELQFQTGGCYHRLSNLFDYLQNGSDDNE